jgi:hypothetical protein
VWRKLRMAKSSSTLRRLLGLLLEEGDKVWEVRISWMSGIIVLTIIDLPLRSLAFLRPPKAILVPGMYFLGFCIDCQHLFATLVDPLVSHTSRYSKRVSSFHSTPLSLLASV